MKPDGSRWGTFRTQAISGLNMDMESPKPT